MTKHFMNSSRENANFKADIGNKSFFKEYRTETIKKVCEGL